MKRIYILFIFVMLPLLTFASAPAYDPLGVCSIEAIITSVEKKAEYKHSCITPGDNYGECPVGAIRYHIPERHVFSLNIQSHSCSSEEGTNTYEKYVLEHGKNSMELYVELLNKDDTFSIGDTITGEVQDNYFLAYELEKLPDIKYYVGNIKKCQIIKYMCKEGWKGFSDTIGCGCEKKEDLLKEKVVTIVENFLSKLDEKGYSSEKKGLMIDLAIQKLEVFESKDTRQKIIITYAIEALEEYKK